MDITWLGDYSFRINDEIINVIVNPTDKTSANPIKSW